MKNLSEGTSQMMNRAWQSPLRQARLVQEGVVLNSPQSIVVKYAARSFEVFANELRCWSSRIGNVEIDTI